MKVHRLFTAVALPLLAATATPALARAQATCGATASGTASCSPAGVSITTTVQRIVRVSVSPAAASLTAPSDVDFASAGTTSITDLGLHSITVRANVAWQITVQGTTWTAPYAKSISDVEWTRNAGTSWTTMSGTAAALQTGSATAGTNVSVGYRTSWSLTNDVPGAYTMPLTFTISST